MQFFGYLANNASCELYKTIQRAGETRCFGFKLEGYMQLPKFRSYHFHFFNNRAPLLSLSTDPVACFF